ncbi:MAG TPA: hypothetical protein VF788_02340, partial [Pseudonocardiaceae bacterium]
GQRVSWHMVELGFQTLTEGGRLELTYPSDSGVWRAKDYGPDELARGVYVGLTEAETTRRVALAERGGAQY